MDDILEIARLKKAELLLEVKSGNHPQFFLDTEAENVSCRCGKKAIWWRTGYICGTITAYPCKYNYPEKYKLN